MKNKSPDWHNHDEGFAIQMRWWGKNCHVNSGGLGQPCPNHPQGVQCRWTQIRRSLGGWRNTPATHENRSGDANPRKAPKWSQIMEGVRGYYFVEGETHTTACARRNISPTNGCYIAPSEEAEFISSVHPCTTAFSRAWQHLHQQRTWRQGKLHWIWPKMT